MIQLKSSSVILQCDGTDVLTNSPVLEEVKTFHYEFKRLKNFTPSWEIYHGWRGELSSGTGDYPVLPTGSA